MKNTLLQVLVVAALLSPAAALAQSAKTKPATATYITKEEIDSVSATEQKKAVVDENVKVIDLGYEHFAVGVIHRSSTRNPPPAPAAANAAAASPAEPCGRQMSSLPPGGTPGGIVHDFQTEGYYIISGGGTVFTDGYIANGNHSNQNNNPGGPNGPTCSGMAYEVRKVVVKTGDVVIVPPGVVHGWLDIPDHVDYLSFRPSQNVLGAGWVNPTIQNNK